MRFCKSLFVAVLVVAAALPAAAVEQPLTLDAVRTQQAEIRTGVQNGTGRYKDLPESKRIELLSKQDFVLVTIKDKQSSDELTQTEKMEVFNALEWIEAAINNAEDERMVCRLERTTGSNRHVRVCKTVAQMREEKEKARDTMMRASRCGNLTCTSN